MARSLQAIYDELNGVRQNLTNLRRGGIKNAVLENQEAALMAELKQAQSQGEPSRRIGGERPVSTRDIMAAGAAPTPRSVSAAPFNNPFGQLAGLRESLPSSVPVPAGFQKGGGPRPRRPASPAPAQPAAPGLTVPPEDTGPLETPLAGLAPTADDYAKADLTPELAALKAAMDAPAPVFKGLAFSKAESAALGFLAGLRGYGAVAPIIEQRRRDAAMTYDAAREARAEKIREAQAVAGLAGQEREIRRESERRREDVAFRERGFQEGIKGRQESARLTERGQDITKRGQDLAAQGRKEAIAARGRGKRVSPEFASKLFTNLNLAKVALDTLSEFERSGHPGGPLAGVGGVAFSPEGKKFRANLQRTQARLRKEIIGTAQSEREQFNTLAFLPSYDSTTETMRSGLSSIRMDLLDNFKSKAEAAIMAGIDMTPAIQKAAALGFKDVARDLAAFQASAMGGGESVMGIEGVGVPAVAAPPPESQDFGVEVDLGP
jgi:hypothetical protein